MGDPVSAGVVGSVVAPELGVAALANPFTTAMTTGIAAGTTAGSTTPWSMGSILNGYGTNLIAGGDVGKGLAINASALAGSGGYGSGGESLFGFDPSLKGIGQGVMESISGAGDWAKQNPMAAMQGFNIANQLLQPHQMRQLGGGGQISRGQIPQMDFTALLNPQQQTVIRPQAMSLL